jgi:hypothetical protein
MTAMPRGLALAISVTDIAFLLYWTVSALAVAGLIAIPPAWMYAGYDKPWVCAWNWSFLPLDACFSLTGLAAVAAARRGLALWRPLALVSLTLTMTAGLMADSYWILMGDFDPAWFLPNLGLVLWPLPYLARLIAGSGAAAPGW